MLLGNDTYSQELARADRRIAWAAARRATPWMSRRPTARFASTRGVYGGKATAVIALKRSPAVVWVRARAMAPADAAGRAPGEVEKVAAGAC